MFYAIVNLKEELFMRPPSFNVDKFLWIEYAESLERELNAQKNVIAQKSASELLDRLKLIIDTERFVDIRKYEECCKIISQLRP
jgi:hypothetical protein